MNIFVGCSSRDVTDNVKWSRYCTATLEVTKFITAHKHTLVFGGCAKGLMGLMYKCMLLNKANIIVAIPQAYINDAEELFYSNLFDFNTVVSARIGFSKILPCIFFCLVASEQLTSFFQA